MNSILFPNPAFQGDPNADCSTVRSNENCVSDFGNLRHRLASCLCHRAAGEGGRCAAGSLGDGLRGQDRLCRHSGRLRQRHQGVHLRGCCDPEGRAEEGGRDPQPWLRLVRRGSEEGRRDEGGRLLQEVGDNHRPTAACASQHRGGFSNPYFFPKSSTSSMRIFSTKSGTCDTRIIAPWY